MRETWARKELMMGFGHRVYKKSDPRNAIHKELSKELADAPGGNKTLCRGRRQYV